MISFLSSVIPNVLKHIKTMSPWGLILLRNIGILKVCMEE
jgi:hypothetical protein